jgi:spore maturation protein CgeB
MISVPQRPLRFAYGHSHASTGEFALDWCERWIARLRTAGIEIYPIQVGVDTRTRRLTWRELDARWRRGDRELMLLYERVARELESYDVFINGGGVNMHPEFLRQLSCTTALLFYDDPFSMEFSKPVAAAHDICLIGNRAEVEGYRPFGVKHLHWVPAGFLADDYDPSLTEEQILSGERSVDVTLLCERVNAHRRAKVDRFALAFPQGVYRGLGWPQGFLPEAERIPLLQRTKIGINIHNWTGPSNYRTYYLPANGVMQICDSKSYLGEIFELGKEVIGYDTIDEAIELSRYYLAHEEERRVIAAAGWRRALRDYNEVAAFEVTIRAVDEFLASKDQRTSVPAQVIATNLARHRQTTRDRRIAHTTALPLTWPLREGLRVTRGVFRRVLRYWDNATLMLKARLRHADRP